MPQPVPLPYPPLRSRRAAGFSLIEVLIVILILSFGLLGIAGLQATTAKYKINTWARSAASVQVSDLADRVRANPRGAGAIIGGNPVLANGYALNANWATQQGEALTIALNCFTTACDAAQRSTFDMLAWRSNVRRMFPQGAAIVTGTVGTGLDVSIAWFDKQFTLVDGTLDTSQVCAAGLTPAARASCCPAALAAPAGVRCTNVTFLP
jgi:type IV pilus assembly protein PilV